MKFFGWLFKEELKPGICECSHQRCSHRDGKYECNLRHGPTHPYTGETAPEGTFWSCACLIYIPKPYVANNKSTPDPELEELRKLIE